MIDPEVQAALSDPERLRALEESGVLDPAPEEAFDRITRTSRRVLGVPMALVNLLDDERQVYKSCIGLPGELESRRVDRLDRSYCKYVVATGEPLVAGDAREHPLLEDNPAIEELEAIAYLGAPLVTSDGHVLGTHCVLDHRPRTWEEHEVELVRDLAAAASTEIDLRRERNRLARLRDELDELVEERTVALRRSERRYRELFEHHVAGAFRSTPGGRLLEVNQAMADLLGYGSPEALEGCDARELFPTGGDRERYLERLHREGRVVNEELRLQRRDGEPVWVLENSLLVEDPGSGETIIQGTLVDITGRKELEEQLRHRALHDPLTGLANRTLLTDRVRLGLARAHRRDDCLGLLMLDLDRFKRVNDERGHTAGDRVLTTVAERLEEAARESDTVARWGGDEFVVLLPDLDDPAEIEPAAERIREAIRAPVPLEGGPVRMNVSAGAVVHGEDRPGAVEVEDHEELMRLGDVALHRAKEGGEGSVHRLTSAD